jgi:hypothetical protein
MTATKDKLVTVESIAALHDYNEKRTKIGYSDTAMESYIDTKVVAGADGSTLVPNVSIIANDKANNSLASINVTDLSSIGDGNSGYITLNAANTDIYSEKFKVSSDTDGAVIALSVPAVETAPTTDTMVELGEQGVNISGSDNMLSGNLYITKGTTSFHGDIRLNQYRNEDGEVVQSNIYCGGDIDCSGDIKSGGNISCKGFINCVNINCEDTVRCDNITFDNVGAVNGTTIEGEYANVIKWISSIKQDGMIDILYRGVLVGSTEFPTRIYGDSIFINTNSSRHPYNPEVNFPGLSNREYGVPKLLWSSVNDRPTWMGVTTVTNGANTATMPVSIDFSDSVGNQPNGIVLVFSAYDVSKNPSETKPKAANVLNENFHSFFVPKAHIISHRSCGNGFTMQRAGMLHHKLLYIGATGISGHEMNMNKEWSFHGQTVNNRRFVLREVWGV